MQEPAIPVPAAYTRQVSFVYSNSPSDEKDDPNFFVKRDIHSSSSTEMSSLREKDDEEEQKESTGKRQKSVLIYIQSARIYIRVLAILIMVVAFCLILTAVIMFGKAQNKPGHPLDNVPKPAAITDQPCIIFTGVAAMNLVLSVLVLSLSCVSSKVSSYRILNLEDSNLVTVQQKQQRHQCRLCDPQCHRIRISYGRMPLSKQGDSTSKRPLVSVVPLFMPTFN